MDVTFAFVARSDVGLVRSNNQDSGYAGPRLLVLADGMGGPAGGDIASSTAVAYLAPLDSDPIPSDEMLTRLRAAMAEAHEELVARSTADPALKGLGTTCIALLRSGNKLAMVHIGDSRAYLFRDGTLLQVTVDHSLVQYLVSTGQITPEEAERHPKRSVVLRILGDSEGTDIPDETLREAVEGDRWLLCSDGLSGVVSAETIAEVLGTIPNREEAADKLVNLALLAGAPDNVTVVLADVVAATELPETTPQIVGAAATDRLAPSRLGQGAAAKAAALAPPPDVEDEEEEPRKKKRLSALGWISIGLVFVLLVAAGVGGWFGYRWSQEQFYVQSDHETVVIYRGIPQRIGPWSLSAPIEVTPVEFTELTLADRQRLQQPVTFSTRDAVDTYLEEIQRRAEQSSPRLSRGQLSQDGPQSGQTSQSGD